MKSHCFSCTQVSVLATNRILAEESIFAVGVINAGCSLCSLDSVQCAFLLKRVQQVKEYRNTNINTQRFAQNTLLYSLAGCAPLYSRFTLIAGVQS